MLAADNWDAARRGPITVTEATGAERNDFRGVASDSTLIHAFSKLNNMFKSTAVPAVGDDINDGVEIGDLWHDTDDNDLYVCLGNAAGAAVWKIMAT
jgi:hypothetical protein